jgi:hypothetical protein
MSKKLELHEDSHYMMMGTGEVDDLENWKWNWEQDARGLSFEEWANLTLKEVFKGYDGCWEDVE